MPDYTISISDKEVKILSVIAEQDKKSVQQILDEQALFRVKEQIVVWCDEYLARTEPLTEEQKTELSDLLVETRFNHLDNIRKKKVIKHGAI